MPSWAARASPAPNSNACAARLKNKPRSAQRAQRKKLFFLCALCALRGLFLQNIFIENPEEFHFIGFAAHGRVAYFNTGHALLDGFVDGIVKEDFGFIIL